MEKSELPWTNIKSDMIFEQHRAPDVLDYAMKFFHRQIDVFEEENGKLDFKDYWLRFALEKEGSKLLVLDIAAYLLFGEHYRSDILSCGMSRFQEELDEWEKENGKLDLKDYWLRITLERK